IILMTAPINKMTDALRRSGMSSNPSPYKAFHLAKAVAVQGRDGNHHVAGELRADHIDAPGSAGQIDLIGQDRVPFPDLGEVCHLVIDVADGPQNALLADAMRVDEVQNEVSVPHRGEGLRHRA